MVLLNYRLYTPGNKTHRKTGFFFNRQSPIGNRQSPGFTFAEILLVTLIIMLITAFSVPLFKRTYDHLQYRNTIENFVTLCTYAREAAILQRTPLWICVDIRSNSFWLGKYYETDRGREFLRFQGKYGRPQSVPERVVLSSTREKIPFFPDGRSERTTVTFRDRSGDQTRVRIKEITGRVEMK